MSESVCLEAKNISLTFRARRGFFRYSYHTALDNVSFDIRKGETVGIVGRNGCGKSTLLKVLADILKPDAGELVSHVNYVSLQSLATGFEKNLSGRDNAILSAMLLGHTLEQATAALPDICDFAELGDSFDEPVKTYSSGMRARLGFSTAMLMHADVLLVDETLGVGDSRFKKKAEAAILDKINSDQTVVFVSHQSSQVERLCNRAVWLEKGQVMEVGDTKTVLNNYQAFLATLPNPQKRK
ncbi:ABC transporter ATP-binding protein [Alteromonas halophila]|uniref:ABC transporter domain-containing protein n=1 Tax=Alteromonas halophila TaxID=516698 RepID=A0A918JIF5_9ALTE|nr:ATP-binding cassette domain-containing protein [Alteromonas halophila]GGW82415.1 hypothetical protein GCM10007391_14320 [Alteromonas halophila]